MSRTASTGINQRPGSRQYLPLLLSCLLSVPAFKAMAGSDYSERELLRQLGVPPPTAQPVPAAARAATQATAEKESNMAGALKFVVGNDIFQPGKQFKSGSGWLALSCSGKNCELEAASLKVVNARFQGHYDEHPTKGQELHFSLSAQPRGKAKVHAWFALPATQSWLTPGPVASYYSGIGRADASGNGPFEAQVRWPGGVAQLVPMAVSRAHRPQLMKKAGWENYGEYVLVLQLRQSGQRQFFPSQLGICSKIVDENASWLLWAGDLDRDGKPDYLLDFSDGAGGSVDFYLSSLAAPGELVAWAGAHQGPPFGGECDGGGWEQELRPYP